MPTLQAADMGKREEPGQLPGISRMNRLNNS